MVERDHVTKRELLLDASTVDLDPSAELDTQLERTATTEHVDERALRLVAHERRLHINEPEPELAHEEVEAAFNPLLRTRAANDLFQALLLGPRNQE